MVIYYHYLILLQLNHHPLMFRFIMNVIVVMLNLKEFVKAFVVLLLHLKYLQDVVAIVAIVVIVIVSYNHFAFFTFELQNYHFVFSIN